MEWALIFLIFIALEMLFGAVLVFFYFTWNIPVTLLRFTGDKGRPLLTHTKARKTLKNGVPTLFVKGYKDPIRDYLAENYYPTMRGKFGGLILWEFEDGLLTPALPEKTIKTLSKEEQEKYKIATDFYRNKAVSFNFDEQLYKDLKLKVVDDVDQEFMLQEQYRLEKQYSGGWRDFIERFGGTLATVLVVVLVLVIVSKFPEYATTCAEVARGIVQENIAREAAAAFAPAG